MADLEAELKAQLKRLKVQVRKPDDNTFVLRNVPADRRFSKPLTSVLVKRPRAGLPFLVCVDEDLHYAGPDRDLAHTFANAACQQGWRVISNGVGLHERPGEAVEQALALLGSGVPARLSAGPRLEPPRANLLPPLSVNLTALVRAGTAPPNLGCEDLAEQVLTSLISHSPRLPAIIGQPGSGKSNLLHEVARQFETKNPAWEFHSVDLSRALAGAIRGHEFDRLLGAVADETVKRPQWAVALERAELALMVEPLTPWMLAGALDRGARIVVTCLPEFREKLSQGPLARRIDLIELTELAPDDALAALTLHCPALAAHHGVGIDTDVIEAAVTRSLTLAGRLPDKAIALLDTACARARLQQQPRVTRCDVYVAASRMKNIA